MTDRHAMDDVPMPEPVELLLTVNTGVSVHQFELNREIKFYNSDQLRAERIAAYELGRNAGLEEAAKWYAEDGWLLDEDSVPGAIRSLKR